MTNQTEQLGRGEWTSASSAQADKLCQGRHIAQKGIPDARTKDSEFGDQIHAALAKASPEGLTAAQESIYDSVLEIEKKLLVKFFGPEVEGMTPNPVCEKRYWAKWPDGLQHSGQLDRVHRKGVKALILDIKSLAGEVTESPSNLQLRDQATLFDLSNAAIQEIGVAIVQPLATHNPEICVYNRASLTIARAEMYQRVVASNRPDSRRTPGELQCKFCRAKTKCVEYNQWAASLLPAPKSLVDVPVKDWTPQQRAEFCNSYDAAYRWLESAWSAMEQGFLKDPEFVPGYKLKPNSPRRSIVNLQSVFNRASESGIPLEEFLSNSGISKTDLTELVKKHAKLKGKQLVDRVDKIIGTDYIEAIVKDSLVKI